MRDRAGHYCCEKFGVIFDRYPGQFDLAGFERVVEFDDSHGDLSRWLPASTVTNRRTGTGSGGVCSSSIWLSGW